MQISRISRIRMIKDQNYFLINASINAFEESRDLKIPWLERDIQQLDPDLFHRDSFDAPATFAQRLPTLLPYDMTRSMGLHQGPILSRNALE